MIWFNQCTWNIGVLSKLETNKVNFSPREECSSVVQLKSGLSLLDRQLTSLFYADDLVLLSPNEQGLQQQLDIVEKYCQNWALAVNMKKTTVMNFPKMSQMSVEQINNPIVEHSRRYNYLGITIAASGSFSKCITRKKL